MATAIHSLELHRVAEEDGKRNAAPLEGSLASPLLPAVEVTINSGVGQRCTVSRTSRGDRGIGDLIITLAPGSRHISRWGGIDLMFLVRPSLSNHNADDIL